MGLIVTGVGTGSRVGSATGANVIGARVRCGASTLLGRGDGD